MLYGGEYLISLKNPSEMKSGRSVNKYNIYPRFSFFSDSLMRRQYKLNKQLPPDVKKTTNPKK